MKLKRTPTQRLLRIAEIIESVDRRCLAADGPVTKTRYEMYDAELVEIYRLARPRADAKGKKE